jgi:hypothetical protein
MCPVVATRGNGPKRYPSIRDIVGKVEAAGAAGARRLAGRYLWTWVSQ